MRNLIGIGRAHPMLRLLLMAFAMFVSPVILAQDHYSISQNRSIYGKTVFLDQSVMGTFGEMSKEGPSGSEKQDWKGFGIRNGIGLEILRFTQISISHTLLNLRSKSSALEHLNGSEFAANLAFSFVSPIGNLFFGASLLGASLDYQDYDKSSSFLGSGYKQAVGLNYFMSPSISLYGVLERSKSTYEGGTGDSGWESVHIDLSAFSFGVKMWL